MRYGWRNAKKLSRFTARALADPHTGSDGRNDTLVCGSMSHPVMGMVFKTTERPESR